MSHSWHQTMWSDTYEGEWDRQILGLVLWQLARHFQRLVQILKSGIQHQCFHFHLQRIQTWKEVSGSSLASISSWCSGASSWFSLSWKEQCQHNALLNRLTQNIGSNLISNLLIYHQTCWNGATSTVCGVSLIDVKWHHWKPKISINWDYPSANLVTNLTTSLS